MKSLYTIFGSIFLVLAMLGIVLPLLPTTPFLLLAAWCYAKGSERLYQWLLHHPWFGNYIQSYRSGKGIPKKTKLKVIALLWVTMSVSIVFTTEILWIRALLAGIAIIITGVLVLLPTWKP